MSTHASVVYSIFIKKRSSKMIFFKLYFAVDFWCCDDFSSGCKRCYFRDRCDFVFPIYCSTLFKLICVVQLGMVLCCPVHHTKRYCVSSSFKCLRELTVSRNVNLCYLFRGGYRYAKILYNVGRAQKKNLTVSGIFAENVKKHPKKVCFYFEEEVWTFKDVRKFYKTEINYPIISFLCDLR